jgi:hypothetical protein
MSVSHSHAGGSSSKVLCECPICQENVSVRRMRFLKRCGECSFLTFLLAFFFVPNKLARLITFSPSCCAGTQATASAPLASAKSALRPTVPSADVQKVQVPRSRYMLRFRLPSAALVPVPVPVLVPLPRLGLGGGQYASLWMRRKRQDP